MITPSFPSRHSCYLWLFLWAVLLTGCEEGSERTSEQKKNTDNQRQTGVDDTDQKTDSEDTDPSHGTLGPDSEPTNESDVQDDTSHGTLGSDVESTSGSDVQDDSSNISDTGEDTEDTANDSGKDTETKVNIPDKASGFLHVEGSKLVDDGGNEARLTGINWFGFETSNQSPHGLWARDYRSMLRQIADFGFNTVRIPWSNAIMRDSAKARSINTYGVDPYDGADPINAELLDKSPLEMLDLIIEAAAEFRLKVMLDNHSREPDGYMEEDFWYTDETSEETWIADWVSLAERYNGNTTVIAMDLNNEPHDDATWGAGDAATDWNQAAEKCGNAILEVNPNVLIVVEGVEAVGEENYWWGGNLIGARNHPINLIIPEKLVYSAHEYGPEVFQQDWFTSPEFPGNMAAIWDKHFGFLVNEQLGHVFIGEFGLKDPDAYGGSAGVWFETFLEYLKNGYSWTFWCLNPNSGDTEGILQHDWLTPHEWKMDMLTPYLAPFID